MGAFAGVISLVAIIRAGTFLGFSAIEWIVSLLLVFLLLPLGYAFLFIWIMTRLNSAFDGRLPGRCGPDLGGI